MIIEICKCLAVAGGGGTFHVSFYDLHVLKAYVPEQIWQVFPLLNLFPVQGIQLSNKTHGMGDLTSFKLAIS